MKIAFNTLGCKLNYAETATYERGLMAAGWEVVPWTDVADVYLINTCAVTETAEKKSRNLIRRAHKTAPQARIVVTGCYAELRKEQLLALDGVWRVFGANEKSSIVPTVTEVLSPESSLRDPSHSQQRSPSTGAGPLPLMRPRVATDSGDNTSSTFGNATFGAYSSGEERTRAFLKVQDGCDNFCAYCTVPYARGRSRNILQKFLKSVKIQHLFRIGKLIFGGAIIGTGRALGIFPGICLDPGNVSEKALVFIDCPAGESLLQQSKGPGNHRRRHGSTVFFIVGIGAQHQLSFLSIDFGIIKYCRTDRVPRSKEVHHFTAVIREL